MQAGKGPPARSAVGAAGRSAVAMARLPRLSGDLWNLNRDLGALLPWNAKTLKVEDFGCILIKHPTGITIKEWGWGGGGGL